MIQAFQNIKLVRKGRLLEIKSEIEKLNLLAESDLENTLMIITTSYKSISSLPTERLLELASRLNETVVKVRDLENEAMKITTELSELK